MILPCAVVAATIVPCLRLGMRAMQVARHIMRLAVVAGEVIIGEVITGIRTMDIPASAITARAMVIPMAAIMVTDPGGAMIRITDIVPADLILTGTGTDRLWASASVAIKLNQHH